MNTFLIIIIICSIFLIMSFFYLSNIFINNESLKKKLQSLIQCCFAKEKDDQLENNESETCKSKICKFETCNLEKQYLVNRAIDQICYYDKSATINKRRYKFCQMLIFILTAFITLSPIVNNEIDKLQPPISATWISAVCGAIIMVITNFVGMNKFHHLMTEHRIVCENIKSRTIEYLCSKHPNDKFKDYIKDIENTINSETNKWAKITTSLNDSLSKMNPK